ncbi:MAG: hypothetical protein IAE86_06520 [Burkholderiaceae bacterium]|nr:hypothetical protein [Burkholderiaceae bacterium]
MARKITKAAPPPAAPPAPENELEVLHPERHLVFGARKVVVREYGHIEWLRLLPQAEPLVAAIAHALEQDRDPTYEEALACLALHIDALAPLIAQAAGLTPDDYAALDPEQGEVLLMTWWGVNGRFFVGRALNRVAVSMREAANRRALQAAADSLATQRS